MFNALNVNMLIVVIHFTFRVNILVSDAVLCDAIILCIKYWMLSLLKIPGF